MSASRSFDVAIIGAGIVGIATAYYLSKYHSVGRLLLIDRATPMSFTSAQSGENYRNWWPRPEMVSLMDRSIDLLEEIALRSDNQINMTRRGYLLASRENTVQPIIAQLRDGLGDCTDKLVRVHVRAEAGHYTRSLHRRWTDTPAGVDILDNRRLVDAVFPGLDPAVQSVTHIRRGGDISSQQLGSYMLTQLRDSGATVVQGQVNDLTDASGFRLRIQHREGSNWVHADRIVNAAGPFAASIAAMLTVDLPVFNTFQQKIAFEDKATAIPRTRPFCIDLDEQYIDWNDDERALLLDDETHRALAGKMPGAIHCRPDGGEGGSWIKLGWAYNTKPADATWNSPLQDHFPEIVLRGAARLHPALKTYYGQLPRALHHYGGWYTRTEENWPLIGPMGPVGAYMNCAHSGFGTMAACAAGELCAKWVAQAELPEYAEKFTLNRFSDPALMSALLASDKGVL